MKRSIIILGLILACQEADDPRLDLPETWTLVAVQTAGGDWREPSDEEQHQLRFLDHETVKFDALDDECIGDYYFETLDHASPKERLVLHVPCMVPAHQLWWEYSIHSFSETEVIAYPRLSPTAYASFDVYRYRINSYHATIQKGLAK